ncbi:MAG TPA: hypothetical protein PKI64_09250 [Kiritimatiellia bacterium]|jgi:hypothetical protein|nr:MAG: hypothetical protein BWX54_01880 [Verrucomicrobia bacterium ADurb.Bin018]HOE01222.1 hypothetical protein [Kiritimatiellia bacterium]HQM23717.1 hypothetical protein [Kiritimatiellia bacterium]
MSTAQDILAGAQRWELLRKRRAKETLRSVFRVDDRYVAKQFEIPLAARRYRRPWLAEDACLRRLDGRGAPRSFGWCEETVGDRRVVWLVKEYVVGAPVETFAAADLPAAARLLAGVHAQAVVTDDASAGNFLRTPDGQMEFLDFGRARPYRRAGWRFDAAIGCELAKLRREGFRWDAALWRAFRPLYFEALGASRGRQIRIRLACAAAVALRQARKTLQGKNPRS